MPPIAVWIAISLLSGAVASAAAYVAARPCLTSSALLTIGTTTACICLGGLLWSWSLSLRSRRGEGDEPTSPDLVNEAARAQINSDLELATDHIASVRVLVDVCRTHAQPVPRSVVQNLDLVHRSLLKVKACVQPRGNTSLGNTIKQAENRRADGILF
jgi:hypothetical protein